MKFTFALLAVVALLVAAVSCQEEDVERQRRRPRIKIGKTLGHIQQGIEIGQQVACLVPGTDVPCPLPGSGFPPPPPLSPLPGPGPQIPLGK
uniref:Uncharacterized protein n=1 Tax=Anopheles albimanus TaxID=7167 RepID=A0A182FWY9_ANOAL